jgi:hypothetical protein
MNNSNNTIKTGFKVIDITGKMDGYVTLEEFMKKTEYKFRCDFNKVGKGFVSSDRVRVYHRIWGRLAPAKIKLDWNDDDAMPFVYYLDQKGRIQFGSSDERHPDLFNKMERCRFNYPHIWFKGRLWSRRKMIVFDQFSDNNKEEIYGQFREFLDIMEHYVKDIHAYKLIFPKAEGRGDVYMNTIEEVFDMCLDESSRLYMKRHSPVGGRWRSLKRQSKFTSDTEGM